MHHLILRWVIETIKSVDESRHLLEATDCLQSEQMLFQFLPDPALPTHIELSMAERLSADDIETNIEVYIPQREFYTLQRMVYFSNRWVDLRDALPSAMSQLCRANSKSSSTQKHKQIYLWKTEDCFYEISKDKAILAAYKIDIDRNQSRLLSMINSPPNSNISYLLRIERCLIDILLNMFRMKNLAKKT